MRPMKIMNPQMYVTDPFFARDPNTGMYVSPDPRTYDVMRSYRQEFETPPLMNNFYVPLNNCDYQPPLSLQKSPNGLAHLRYSGYHDITLGNVLYRSNPDTDVPFVRDQYDIDNNPEPYMFVTPMGAVEPTYELSAEPEDFNVSPDSETNNQLMFRTDIISRQQRKRNQQQWMYSYI